ncbi:MAG TPA: hypothetical protein VMV49_09290 [Candidatus Deferrimicrobium sp.]|nr:hypothetical protein [Candidatus Deferrimicrobium sp.]
MSKESISKEELEKKDIPALLNLFIDTKRLQKAKMIIYSDIRIIFQSEEEYMYEIKGTKQTYFLKIDLRNKVLVHNCEDWVRRCMRDNLLCKHFGRIFQEIYPKDAKKILIDMCLNSWSFLDTDDYLKNK